MENLITEYYKKHIVFDEKPHIYTYDGIQCISATTLIGSLEKPFDAEFHSARIAQRDGREQADILQEWEDKKNLAGYRGTGIHRWLECRYLGIEYDHPYKISAIELEACEGVLKDITDRRVEPYGIEVVMGSKKYLLCGTADFIGRKKNGEFVIYDWKTNKGKNLKTSGYFDSPLKAPLWHLKGSKNMIYSLQLSLYNEILKENFDWYEGATELALYHIDGGFERIDLKEKSRAIRDLFKHRLKLIS